MAEEFNGSKLNNALSSYISRRIEGLYVADSVNSASVDTDRYTVTRAGRLIKAEDNELYDTLIEMNIYLTHKNMDPTDTYVLPHAKFKDESGVEHEVTLYVPKADSYKIVTFADKFTKLIGISFPEQLFQLLFKDTKVPGTDKCLPEPRLLSESEEEYEARLESFYADTIHKRENVADSGIRRPYYHETVRYRDGDRPVDGYSNEYYAGYVKSASGKAIKSSPAGTDPDPSKDDPSKKAGAGSSGGSSSGSSAGSSSGSSGSGSGSAPGSGSGSTGSSGSAASAGLGDDSGPVVIKESDDYDVTPLGQKVGTGLNTAGTTIKSNSFLSKLKIWAGGAISVGGIWGVVATHSLVPAAIAALGIGAIWVGGKAAINFSNKHIKPFWDDLFFGKKKKKGDPTPTPPGGAGTSGGTGTPAGGSGGPGGSGGSTPPKGHIVVEPAMIEGFVATIEHEMEQYRELEAKIKLNNDNIKALKDIDPANPLIAKLEQQNLEYIAQMKEYLHIMSGFTSDFIMGLDENRKLEGDGRTHGSH